ncbi:MAG: PDZ domain-containing protein, partial [Vampirovibrionia bacterium]
MNKLFKAKIIKTLPGSIAESKGLKPGDSLLAIDNKAIRDLLDYQFAIYDTEKLSLLIEKENAEQQTITITKPADDDLGLIFESGVFDKIKPCNNNCIFCFVDQQPDGLRDSLYIKDDDYRLSYLQGTYITLTNLTSSDKKRIEDLRLGPLYISVHTTNPELRTKILNNKKASDIMDKLIWLEDLGIPVHAQIVVCPGFNDNDELIKTLKDLSKLENVDTVAVVPVGITRFRNNSPLKPFNKD